VVVSLRVSGTTSLTAIGETSQLSVTATYTNGNTMNVSTQVRWISNSAAVATMSPDGLLTAAGFGSTTITAYLPDTGTSRSVSVTVLAPGTFVVSGRVREPGAGSLSGVRISDPVSGLSTLSGGDGDYQLVSVRSLRIVFEKAGYESRTIDASGSDDVPMQPIARVGMGGSVTTTIAPNDLSYQVTPGAVCEPCRLVRIATTPGARLEVRATWPTPQARVMLWVEGRLFDRVGNVLEIVAEGTGTSQEMIVYATMIRLPGSFHVPVTITANPK
jgi:hypothetical protein